MKKNSFLRIITMMLVLSGINAYAGQNLVCTDVQGNTLELHASKHITGALTLKDPSTKSISRYKIDIGGLYGETTYYILAASPALNGSFTFSDPLNWDMTGIESVRLHSGQLAPVAFDPAFEPVDFNCISAQE